MTGPEWIAIIGAIGATIWRAESLIRVISECIRDVAHRPITVRVVLVADDSPQGGRADTSGRDAP